jgi:hypothetical protein
MFRLLVPVLAALALFAAGCGGNGNGGDETLSTTEWADGLCGAITTWTDSLQSAAESFTSGDISREALQEAVDDIQSSTETFTEDLGELGRPDMESGQEAKDLLDGLDEELDDNLQELQTAVEDTNASNILNTVSTVTTTLGAMAQQISSAFQELDQIDASNELEQAFEEADNCAEIPSSQR